ncbi:hypothetical protein [Ruegeria sp. R14_0]|uniref:hypothetical protein n=1 Tax=Ruegeria sp. R14_0 TaxID=2821100 RepID=UPI001ADB9FA5|nr:hypothetical protein [Ruegeria sp. R14_0]MBO9446538.1 hypothetical protein [Ruegeria sp. R14_0]
MAHLKDLKMAALAAMIVLAATLAGKEEERLGDVQPHFNEAPRIETRILAG